MSEQAAKMHLNYENKYIVIEGDPYKVVSAIHRNAIIGQMTSLVVKHNAKIILIDSIEQFPYTCYSIVSKHLELGRFNPVEFRPLKVKSDDKDILVAMLYQIPRLGEDKARKIAERYNYSLSKLIHEVSKEELEKIDGIGEIMSGKILELVKK